ncbi:hypothetical protein N7457_005570 [Penicillium paradoxum]|uniref:uncharacterized protein n=1 Tax=Penicillium paradoxum TaxID=176176 RepID=UPI002547ED3F|nr:uncharacterized protein N7457_005570 [Penicillium paradoxum]KAJ5780410.1 hypothetical protein N7457_005570 [Penicillium paradoxum]
MKFLAMTLALFSASAWTVNAVPTPEEVGTLAWRAWDLRFLSEAPPVCNSSVSNIEYSIGRRYGQSGRTCEQIFNEPEEIKSISWKAPMISYRFDLCMFGTDDCAPESYLAKITNDWDVCYLYNGFQSYSVVSKGDPCFPDGSDEGDGEEQQ